MYPQYSQDILPIGLVGKIQWADTVTVKVGAEQGSGRKPLPISGSWFCFCPSYFTCNILILSTCCCRLHYFRRLRSWIVFSFPNVVQRLITSRSSPLHGIICLLTAHDLISHDSFGERWPYLSALRWGKVKLLKYDERKKSLEYLNTKNWQVACGRAPPRYVTWDDDLYTYTPTTNDFLLRYYGPTIRVTAGMLSLSQLRLHHGWKPILSSVSATPGKDDSTVGVKNSLLWGILDHEPAAART